MRTTTTGNARARAALLAIAGATTLLSACRGGSTAPSPAVENTASPVSPVPSAIATVTSQASPAPSPAPPVTATPTPTPTPTPQSIALTPTVSSFDATGYEQRFTASEAGYAGTFAATSTDCTSIATFSPSQATSAPYTFTVTSVTAGTCHVAIADSFGQTAIETIVVTTTGGTIDVRPHRH